jgi:succinate dehydrogenase/fumarate reductase flavoprotein subunit
MIKNLLRKWPGPNSYKAKGPRPEGIVGQEYAIYDHTYDAVVVGAGAAGLRASVALAEKGYHTACISKLFPIRSHTVVAQTGINAALGNVEEDHWHYHYYDTVQSSQGLGDLDAINYMCKEAASAMYELENYGMPFSRTAQGKILQKALKGQTIHYGLQPAVRSAIAGEKTGLSILNTLTGKAMELECRILVDYVVLELIIFEGECKGVIAMDLAEGAIHKIQAHSTIIATGGYGRIFTSTSHSFTCTGDGQALVSKAGLPNQDLEFIQFCPTGLHGHSYYVNDLAREIGGKLVNGMGEKFMNKYSELGDKASNDVAVRAMANEIYQGRGSGSKRDHLLLDLTGVESSVIESELKGLHESINAFKNLDLHKSLIPVAPTAYYTLGGIPTDSKARVIKNSNGDFMYGLYAAGEAACVSVHGASILPGNSLIDSLIFGKTAANTISETVKPREKHLKISNKAAEDLIEKIESVRVSKGKHNVWDIREKLQSTMQSHAGVFRNEKSLNEAIKIVEELGRQLKDIRIYDRGIWYNIEMLDALELENMIILSRQTLLAAKYRKESRGNHIRQDYPNRNDKEWKKHSMTWLHSIDGEIGYETRPVVTVPIDTSVPDIGQRSSDILNN